MLINLLAIVFIIVVCVVVPALVVGLRWMLSRTEHRPEVRGFEVQVPGQEQFPLLEQERNTRPRL